MSIIGNLYKVTEKELEKYLKNPDDIEDVLYPDEEVNNEDKECDLDKAWCAIDFLIESLSEKAVIPEIFPIAEHIARGDVEPYHGMGSALGFGDGSAAYAHDKNGSKFITRMQTDRSAGYHRSPGPLNESYNATGVWYSLDQEY